MSTNQRACFTLGHLRHLHLLAEAAIVGDYLPPLGRKVGQKTRQKTGRFDVDFGQRIVQRPQDVGELTARVVLLHNQPQMTDILDRRGRRLADIDSEQLGNIPDHLHHIVVLIIVLLYNLIARSSILLFLNNLWI